MTFQPISFQLWKYPNLPFAKTQREGAVRELLWKAGSAGWWFQVPPMPEHTGLAVVPATASWMEEIRKGLRIPLSPLKVQAKGLQQL